MDKMNFSRFTYFEAFVKNIAVLTKKQLAVKKQTICDEIDFQINKIYIKQKGGYWPITSGDKVFISFMYQLRDAVSSGLSLDKIQKLLGSASEKSENKIKIVFFTQETVAWPSFDSVYNSCIHDDRYEAQLVYIPFDHIDLDKMVDYLKIYQENMGFNIIPHDQYNISAESPDVAIFMKPYDCIPMQYYITDVDKVVSRCIYIPYGMEIGSAPESFTYQYQLPLHFKAWKVLAYAPFYKNRAARYGYRNGVNYITIGHPRMDLYHKVQQKDQIASDFLIKANGRKIFLWNTHFTIEPGCTWGSYLEWGEDILNFAKQHPEIFVLWRPHPFFFGALAKIKDLSGEKVQQFFNDLKVNENICIDRSSTYLSAFTASDALISDANSFLPEYLVTGKPILYTPKTGGAPLSDPALLEDLYVVQNKQDIERFFNMVYEGKDPMKTQRLASIPNHVTIPESGTVATNLLNLIHKELLDEEQNINLLR